MCKKILMGFLAFFTLCLVPISAFSATATKEITASQLQNSVIVIDGKEKAFKDAKGNQLYPIEYAGTVYVPLKTVESASGKTTIWNTANEQVVIGDPVPEAKDKKPEVRTPVSRTVYWVPNGKSYHFSNSCSTLSRSNTILSGTLDQAISNGKSDPCNVCAGGK